MAKLSLTFILILASFLAFAESDQTKLDKVRADKKKIQEYMKQGITGPEISQELKKLSQQETQLVNTILSKRRKETAKRKKISKEKKSLPNPSR